MSARAILAGLVLAVTLAISGEASAQGAATTGPDVRTTIIPGTPRAPLPRSAPIATLRSGDVTLNFPSAEVGVVAKAVLGDLLGLEFTVPADLHTPVTLVTQKPIARGDVFKLFEASLANADLAVVFRDGVYAILPTEQAHAQAPVANGPVTGFATETINLSFVNADALKRLIDPILPNVIVSADASRNVIVVAGTTGQREAVRDLIREFDVNWLRNTSFALYIPQRTDARLIVPELDKLINADGSPTKGLVHLIAMDSLNGILAVSTQPQYLEDVRRWIDVLDREGESSERRIFVYRVQNGRSSDLARVLANAFGKGGQASSETGHPSAITRDDLNPSASTVSGAQGQSQSQTTPSSAMAGSGMPTIGPSNSGSAKAGPADADVSVDIATDGLHAKISSDEANNAIVVFATPRDYAVVEDALRKLDVFPSQVMIEAAITEVTLTDQLRYGVQWQFASGRNSGELSEAATGLPTQNFPGFSYFYAGKSISATLNALENLTHIKVVSAPKLQVLNNQTAQLQVGDSVPIITGSATSTIGSNAPIVNSVDYRDIGIILKITPRVNSSGVVLLDVEQEVSDVVPTLTPGIASPTFSMRRIATSIAVQDGEVVALGGLISDSQTKGSNGIPFLSRIPLIGPSLFGNNDNSGTKTELLVLLRPKVVHNVDDGRAVTEELKAKLQSLRPLLPADNSIP